MNEHPQDYAKRQWGCPSNLKLIPFLVHIALFRMRHK